jgi:HEAT repeat protein
MMPERALSPQERIVALEAAVAADGRETAILSALGDPSTLVRERAIALAARHLAPETLGNLLREGENAVLRNAGFAALERQGPYAVPHLLKLTLDADYEVALFAVQLLSITNDSSARHRLLPLIDHPDRNVAQTAIEAVGNASVIEAVPALIRLLHADLWLQFAAVSALGKIGDARAVAPLLDLLDSDMLAESAAEALGRIASPASLVALCQRVAATDRLPLRDQLLMAVANILERNRLSARTATIIRALFSDQRWATELFEYLRNVLGSDDLPLARAAAGLVVSVHLDELMPAVLLRTGEPDEARWTAALLQRRQKSIRNVLGNLLASDDLRVRRGALLCGEFDAKHTKQIIACLRDPHTDVRAAACTAVGRLRRAEAIPFLLENLRSGQPPERAAAAQALGQMPGDQLGVLEPELALDAPIERVLIALQILETARSPALRGSIVAMLEDPRPDIRHAALQVVGRYSDAHAERLVFDMLGDPDPTVRTEAVEILVRRGCQDAGAAFARLLEVPDNLRYHVIRGLGRLRISSSVPKLIDIYPEALAHERIEIVAALNQVGGPEVLAFLKRRLTENDVEIRRVASDGLARLATSAEIEHLVALAVDGDWTVRSHAAWGLGRLGLPSVREPLLTLARDVEPIVARTARVALAKLGPASVTVPE